MLEPQHHALCRALGDRIKELRRNISISQSDLADLAELHPSIIGKIERGTGNPKLETLARLALALDTEISDLTVYVTKDLVEPKENKRVTAKDLIQARRDAADKIKQNKRSS